MYKSVHTLYIRHVAFPWFKRRERAYVDTFSTIDIDMNQENVALGDMGDATSFLFQITMKHGATTVTFDSKTHDWIATVAEQTFHGESQLAALQAAWRQLES